MIPAFPTRAIPIQVLKALFQSLKSIDACLKGLLLISKLINSELSGSPMGPKKGIPGLSLKGMMI
jgi:hypothetical protein